LASIRKPGGASIKKAAKPAKKSARSNTAVKKAKLGGAKKRAPTAAAYRAPSDGTAPARKRPARGKKVSDLAPQVAGYVRSTGGVLVPVNLPQQVVPASKIKRGFAEAKRQFDSTIAEVIREFGDGYEIAEIEVSASFSADGKFMGFGAGGAAAITLRIRPAE
jgi:hypothetical protein